MTPSAAAPKMTPDPLTVPWATFSPVHDEGQAKL
jgi:hypothetical protein